MSKPISFGFGKPKGQLPAPGLTKTSISLPTKASLHKSTTTHGIKSSALRDDDDDDDQDDEVPKHEELTGFSASGAILSKAIEQKKELVIENAGNQDWRRKAQQGRGKNILPAEVQAQRNGENNVLVEKNEVSKASGLQFATSDPSADTTNTITTTASGVPPTIAVREPRTVDEEALQALLSNDDNASRGTAIIEAADDALNLQAPAEDFRTLVAAHPDSATLEDYNAVPVEGYGLAMLRGMGKKRRANGEVIQLESTEQKQKEIKKRKQEGFLGIGATAAKGMEGVELGAWGKSEMRKNARGEGFFTPVMVRDRETGETITEEELERRKKTGTKSVQEEDWRERRDKNLDRSMKNPSTENGYENGRKSLARIKPAGESDHESSRSRRHRSRSRSRDKRRRDGDYGYESRSSGGLRDRDRDRDRNRDMRHKDRSRDDDRDERRYRDRR